MAAVNSPKPQQFQIKVKKWQAVCEWQHELKSEQCGICKANLHDPCIKCALQTNDAMTDNKCNRCVGVCGHTFHFHCISTWFDENNDTKCCLCNKTWEIGSIQ